MCPSSSKLACSRVVSSLWKISKTRIWINSGVIWRLTRLRVCEMLQNGGKICVSRAYHSWKRWVSSPRNEIQLQYWKLGHHARGPQRWRLLEQLHRKWWGVRNQWCDRCGQDSAVYAGLLVCTSAQDIRRFWVRELVHWHMWWFLNRLTQWNVEMLQDNIFIMYCF